MEGLQVAIWDKKVTKNTPSYLDFVGGGVAKFAIQNVSALTPIGDGNLVSGGVKLVGGYLVKEYAGGGLLGNSVAIGAAVDGIEDCILGGIRLLQGGGIGFGTILGSNADTAWATAQ